MISMEAQKVIQEIPRTAISGALALSMLLLAIAADVALFVVGIVQQSPLMVIGSVLFFVILVFLLFGLFIVNPNEARVLQLFGRYVGTVADQGLRWANPFYTKRRISLRVRNFETDRSKVNDADGNPIEIAAVVVWKVVDTAEATFEVDDYVNFMHVQSESAVRNLATQYPYDTRQDDQISLRGKTEEIAGQLKTEIQGRLHKAGLEVLEARITHLAYAPEIASSMLQRQQAGAIIEARERIVEGAVSMVQMALDNLSSRGIVDLDEERKAAMVSNLLVVLCGDKGTQPVLNTGTLYR
ncbi:MAG: SPFH domain-containing protein [Gammaproteobacteria bacterium]|nr:SPFH domain-containing protein [Gammaproteobacteria bacterium]